MAEESQSFVAIFSHCFARVLLEHLACSTPTDALQSGGPVGLRLGADFQCFQGGATGVTTEALWMQTHIVSGEGDEATFDRMVAFVAASCGTVTNGVGSRRGPIATWTAGADTGSVLLWSRERSTFGYLGGGVIWGYNDGNVRASVVVVVVVTGQYN